MRSCREPFLSYLYDRVANMCSPKMPQGLPVQAPLSKSNAARKKNLDRGPPQKLYLSPT